MNTIVYGVRRARLAFALSALVALALTAALFAQQSPAPDRPAEGALRVAAPPSWQPGPAPGVHRESGPGSGCRG